MLAQAVTGTPGHVNSMANAVKHFLAVYPLATMKPGDHYITNDPWLTSGHLHDITVVTPASTGASRWACSPIPSMSLTSADWVWGGWAAGVRGRPRHSDHVPGAGRPVNEDLLRMVRANVREPLQVEGDIYACAASNHEGARHSRR